MVTVSWPDSIPVGSFSGPIPGAVAKLPLPDPSKTRPVGRQEELLETWPNRNSSSTQHNSFTS
mgnify:CR=1 FL=1